MPSDLDVVIRGDTSAASFGLLIGYAGQGHQSGPVDGLEELPPRLAPSLRIRRALSSSTSTRMGDVQLRQREEAPVTQPRQDPALRDLDGDLDLGLVARLARPRRHDGRAVMGGEVLIDSLEAR